MEHRLKRGRDEAEGIAADERVRKTVDGMLADTTFARTRVRTFARHQREAIGDRRYGGGNVPYGDIVE